MIKVLVMASVWATAPALAQLPGAARPGPATSTEASQDLVGGYRIAPTDRADVVDAAIFAVRTINERTSSSTPYTLSAIVSAKSQVVSGMNYALELALVRGDVREIHDVVVYSQPWTSTLELTADRIRP
jgi:hypothetical protein